MNRIGIDGVSLGMRRIAALVTASIMAVVATVVLIPAPAEALGPIPTGNPYSAWDSYGTMYASEWARYTSTCNGDTIYAGKVVDEDEDGSCAYIQYRQNWGYSWSIQGYDCTETGTNYAYYDSNGDSYAQVRLGRKVAGVYKWDNQHVNSGY